MSAKIHLKNRLVIRPPNLPIPDINGRTSRTNRHKNALLNATAVQMHTKIMHEQRKLLANVYLCKCYLLLSLNSLHSTDISVISGCKKLDCAVYGGVNSYKLSINLNTQGKAGSHQRQLNQKIMHEQWKPGSAVNKFLLRIVPAVLSPGEITLFYAIPCTV